MNMVWWHNLDPNKKRWIAIACGAFVFFVFVSLTTSNPEKEVRKSRKDTIKHVITDKSMRESGIDALIANIKKTKSEQDKQKKEIASLKEKVDNTSNTSADASQVKKDLDQLKASIKKLEQENDELNKTLGIQKREISRNAKAAKTPKLKNKVADKTETEADVLAQNESLSDVDANQFFEKAPIPQGTVSKLGPKNRNHKNEPVKTIRIVNHSQNVPEEQTTTDPDEDGVYLPVGSIITGVTLTGMDAPTSVGARKDPFPTMIRVQKNAILPNRFSADVKECFIILSGYGDLSSERAYLRGENLSCITEDGKNIETTLDAYAVGEDGKSGVRGRLVSKQGALIARSLVAGFASGFAQALDTNPVPVINTSPEGGSPIYQDVLNANTVKSGVSKGVSSAMEKIADFYLEMANSMFPVIEIDAGRQIDIIVTKGQMLKARG